MGEDKKNKGLGGKIAAVTTAVASALSLGGCVDGFDPAQNQPRVVYGPPSYFDAANNVPEEVYGPPVEDEDTFRVEENYIAVVYGPPPEDFPAGGAD